MDEAGRLIASGRAADVYEHGDGLVLRRYRTPHIALHEAAVMHHAVAHGFPAPRVVSVQGGDIVMERVEGPTMLARIAQRPLELWRHAATLAELFRRLHAIPVTAWMEDRLGGGDALVHLDLHPDNVIVSPRGPVVIDWSNAGRGDPDTELADLWIIASIAVLPGSPVQRAILGAGRRLFTRSLIGRFDRDAIRRKVRLAGAHRARDPNMSDVERRRISRFVERYALDD